MDYNEIGYFIGYNLKELFFLVIICCWILLNIGLFWSCGNKGFFETAKFLFKK